MARVLGLSASPRTDGNTSALVKHILDKTKRKGIETKFISFGECDIQPCNGCGKCAEDGKCNIDDDCEKLFKAIGESDFIVVGCPVYRLGVPSQFKALMDRSTVLVRRGEFFSGKFAGIVVVGRGLGTGKIITTNTIVDFLLSVDIGVIPPLIVGHAHQKGEIKEDRMAFALGEELAGRIRRLVLD